MTLPKLNDIAVYNNNSLVKKFSFSFIENINERLKLEFIKAHDLVNLTDLNYKLSYNNEKLPTYGTAKTDHWGYYNNVDYFATTPGPYTFDKLNTDYVLSRSANHIYSKAEILEKLILPTGGEISFSYEANKYSKVANLWPFTLSDLAVDKEGGGVRISKIITKENGNITDEKEYLYSKPNTTISSGILAVPIPNYTVGTALDYGFRAEAFNPFNQRGNSVVYTRVVEKFKNNGYKVYDYKNFDNGSNDKGPIIELPLNVHHLYNKDSYNSLSYQRGKLSKESVYNNLNQLLKETEYQYTHENSIPFKLRNIHYMPAIRWTKKIYLAAAYETDFYNDLLVSTKTKEYSTNGILNESLNNKYDEFNNIIEAQSFDNKGNIIKKKFKYAYSYSLPGVDQVSLGIKNLIQSNCKNYVVEEIITKEDANTLQVTVLGATLYTYKLQSPFIDKVFKLQIATPILLASFTPSNIVNGNFIKDARYMQPDATMDLYDTKGNALQITNKYNQITSKICDYNDRFIIAEVNNASYSDIAATSFEADTKGNFSFDGTSAINTTALTGKKVYDLSRGSISKTGLNATKTYIVTYWSKNGQQKVNSSNAIVGPIKNSWTLYKHEVVKPANGNIVISGTGNIDELRLYPKEAQVNTYTYEPLIGVTTQCDASDNIIYYKYDGFNRLTYVYDINKKIIRKVCYNSAGQPENCATGITYYNQQLSQAFIRNNCPPKYIGSEVLYTVPANTYSSETSQADANIQAQNEIDANGQAYANINGTCTIYYARISYENVNSYGGNSTGDVVVKFYSDQACTIPTSVTNLPIDFNINYGQQFNKIANGFQTTLWQEATLSYEEYECDYGYWPCYNNVYYYDYYLSPSPNYQIVN
ncbi:MAG: hypothetical protein IPJ81_03770 [Chitinophagaceae bacterium]|nr:hypothetical protein [Chitinophagaceae bacterium]